MKKLVTFLFILISNISLAQTGWGYVNYTSYKTHNGNGSTTQYSQFAQTATDFVTMFNTANSNTTIFKTGEVTLQTMASGSSTVPRWSNDYFGYKFEFWFIPQETGTYRFGINSDDASDLSIDGTMITTYYGGHGAGGYQIGSINMVAGQRYSVVARFQEYGGGEAFYLLWSRPSSPTAYSYWNNEVTNKNSEPSKKAVMNFDFGSVLDKTKFSIGSTTLSSTGWIDVTSNLDTTLVNAKYKTQSVTMATTNILSTLYNSIITVSDVYLAFKELANGGILGNENGKEFTYGIQYKNADVNEDGIFNEGDCFKLLQHLTGIKNIVDTFSLNKTMKIFPTTMYNGITKSNWNTTSSYLGSTYQFGINTEKSIDTFNLSVSWKGDVNLSHSPIQIINNVIGNSMNSMLVNSKNTNNEITASVLTEMIGDSIYAYITIDPLNENLVGTQFKLNYDNSILQFNRVTFNTKGYPMNYANDAKTYISLGSLVTDGITTLDKTTEYKISFSAKVKLDNILGLISIGETDAINQNGTSLKIKIN